MIDRQSPGAKKCRIFDGCELIGQLEEQKEERGGRVLALTTLFLAFSECQAGSGSGHSVRVKRECPSLRVPLPSSPFVSIINNNSYVYYSMCLSVLSQRTVHGLVVLCTVLASVGLMLVDNGEVL